MQLMGETDKNNCNLRDCNMLSRHPELEPRDRSMILNWLMVLCDIHKLHRETYYLALDYLDRYLTSQKNVGKSDLELIAITCLFVAAKLEEMYSPDIKEFVYLTNRDYHESDILDQENLLLQVLQCGSTPITPIGWLGVYMQLNVCNRMMNWSQIIPNLTHNKYTKAPIPKSPSISHPAFIDNNNTSVQSHCSEVDGGPQFSGLDFMQTAQLMDVCSLDIGFGNFTYSVVAAAAISHKFDKGTAIRCSGLDWQTIQPCASWMHPFAQAMSEKPHLEYLNPDLNIKFLLIASIACDGLHILQTLVISTMDLFNRGCFLQLLKIAATAFDEEPNQQNLQDIN